MAAVVYLILFALFVLLEIANVRGTLHPTLAALVGKS